MKHSLLFTGHMIDAANRSEERFPASKEMAVKIEIRNQLFWKKQKGEITKAISGGACGGDIIFLEVCEEFGIPIEICLALPPDEFKQQSVSFAGADWEERFDRLTQKYPVLILPEEKNKEADHNLWAATNAWMLERAVEAEQQSSLIALWNGKGGDGKGGTEHMIHMAKEKCADIVIIDINTL